MRWGEYSGDGLFNRKVILRGNIAQLAIQQGKIVIKICVNREGDVVWAEYDKENSSIHDQDVIRRAEATAEEYLFEADRSAPKQQCGALTFIFENDSNDPRQQEANRQAQYKESKKQFSDLLIGSRKRSIDLIGGGLGNRGVLYAPEISDSFLNEGRVVVKICVDSNGDVISAVYTRRGSTTTDSELKELAIRSAKEFRFTESDIEKQCGTITIDFKVQ